MRSFTTEQKALLNAPSITMRILMTFFLDEGTYYFCDDIKDVSNGVNTFIGANPLAGSIEIRSGRDLSAEPVTLTLDGNKMAQAGITDPARVLRDILGYLHQQRRVDIAFGFSYPDSQEVNLTIPTAAMKINHCRLVDEEMSMGVGGGEASAKLDIVMDSLAARYTRTPFRTRSHDDQKEISSTDMFFSFTADALNTEKTLYWGKRSSVNGSTGGGSSPGSGGGGGGGFSYSGGGMNSDLPGPGLSHY